MYLDRVQLERGWRSKLVITAPGTAILWTHSFNAEAIPSAELVCERVQAVEDFETFKRFCKRYGLLMLWPQVRDYVESKQPANLSRSGDFGGLAAKGFTIAVTSIPEDTLTELWEFCRPDIEKLQADLKKLAKLKSSEGSKPFLFGGQKASRTVKGKKQYLEIPNRDRYLSKLAAGLAPARLKIAAKPGAEAFGFFMHAADLRTACYLELASFADFPLKTCQRPGCGRVLVQRRTEKKYCPTCRPRKDSPERAAKKKLYNKLYYLYLKDKDKQNAKAFDTEAHKRLRLAKTVPQIEAVGTWIDEQVSEKKNQQGKTPGRGQK